MFPIHDDNRDRRLFPVVNIVLIVINVFVFFVLQGMGANDDFTYAWSTVPQEIMTGTDIVTQDSVQQANIEGQVVQYKVPGLKKTPVSVYLTLLTAMFMHGGIGHIFGNMWFLWIFGDNIENDLGRLWYTLFYLASGLLAGLAHVFGTYILSGPESPGMLIPCLGASGAISGVMGAYLVLHPLRKVTVLLLRFYMEVPGYVAVGLWFGMQVVLSLFSGGEGGVAYGAHIGGFIAGAVLVLPLRFLSRPTSPDLRASTLRDGFRSDDDWRN